MPTVNLVKNRTRDPFSFANINLLDRCNVRCFFCLGLDLEEKISGFRHNAVHFSEWPNFSKFLDLCQKEGVAKIYITGQNTDSLLYRHLGELVDFLHNSKFQVGLRTNGYLALKKLGIINRCELSTGYSIHSLCPVTNRMIMGRVDIPDWPTIIPATERPRISIVLNRCNRYEFFDLLRYLAQFKNIRYVQVRRVSTDRRTEILMPDMAAYEEVYSQVRDIFPLTRRFVTDAEEYEIYGQKVVFWRTVKTSTNSLNFFTDGTISDMYFIVEGYLKYSQR